MRNLLVVVGLFALAACGGGGNKSDPEPVSGTLEAGRATGIIYQTPTQAGTTDANGTFRYVPGETVAFSIGGVQLGAVPGAAKISLFTLAGLTAPTSELTLRRELDRALRQPTPLVRAMNLSRLLIALDADSNPDNGIDVSGRAGDLAGKQIDLGLGLHAFAGKLDRLAPNLTRNIPMSRVLAFAYQASNLTVATHSPVRYDSEGTQQPARFSTVTYLPNGARSVDETRTDFVGLSTTLTTYSYDALGRMSGISSQSSLGLSQPLSGSTSAVTFDSRGNRTFSVNQLFLGGETTYRNESTETTDAFGRLTEQGLAVDDDGDGADDSRQVTQTTYDARGNPVSSLTTYDRDNDGNVDQRSTFTATFDANDRLQSELYESDGDADGVVDVRVTTTVENDGPSTIVRTVSEDDGADGVVDFRTVTRYTYDQAGNNTSTTVLDSSGTQDAVYAYAVFTMTYDAERRVLSNSRVQYTEVGGTPYSSYSYVNTYDDRGNITRTVTDTSNEYFNGPSRYVSEFEYGPQGERTRFGSSIDNNADGTVDYEYSTQVTNQEFSDGVLMLAQQYFEFTGALSLDYVGVIGGGVVGL
jgi:hypothetical protein